MPVNCESYETTTMANEPDVTGEHLRGQIQANCDTDAHQIKGRPSEPKMTEGTNVVGSA
jgi:hypothetical protein